MEEIQNYLETLYEIIKDYLIDKEINIHNEDTFKTKSKKFLIKYKRLIGLISLIILILIPYYCFDREEFPIQKGGVISVADAAKHFKDKAASTEALKAGKAEFEKEQKKAKSQATKDKFLAKDLEGKPLQRVGAIGYRAGAVVGEAFKDNADWFYGLLYSIAATVAIFMLVVPSIAFFAIGIMCFFLLKDKIKYFKGL